MHVNKKNRKHHNTKENTTTNKKKTKKRETEKAKKKKRIKKKKKIRDGFMKNVNNPKVRDSRFTYGWNELLVYDIKVKDAFIVLDALAAPGDHEGLEKSLKKKKEREVI